MFPLNHEHILLLNQLLFACTLPLRPCQSFTAHGNLVNLHEITGLDCYSFTIIDCAAAALILHCVNQISLCYYYNSVLVQYSKRLMLWQVQKIALWLQKMF